jgi:hypothetical protein
MLRGLPITDGVAVPADWRLRLGGLSRLFVLLTVQVLLSCANFLGREFSQLLGSDSPGSQEARLRSPTEEEIRATDETRIEHGSEKVCCRTQRAAVTFVEIRVSSVFHPWRLSSSAFHDRNVSVEPPTRI